MVAIFKGNNFGASKKRAARLESERDLLARKDAEVKDFLCLEWWWL